MRLVSRILTRVLMPVVVGALLFGWRADMALAPGAAAPAGPGTVDPAAEADRVAAIMRDLGAALRNGTPLPAGVPPTGRVAPAPAPSFVTASPRPASDCPRILNGGGAGTFHRAPQPAR